MELHFNPHYVSNYVDYIYTQMNGYFTNTTSKYEECKQRIMDNQHKLCIGIKPEHIRASLENSDAIIISNNGFITIKIMEDTQILYVELICASKGTGSQFMNILETLAEKISFTEIKLKSVTNAVKFYLNNGYSCDKLCNMKKSIKNSTSYGYGGSRKRKYRKSKKRHTRRLRF